MNNEEKLKTGTTTVGILCKDCVILAADRRATAGHMIVDKHIHKVVPVSDNIAVTTAGSVSDLQLLLKYIKSDISLRKIRSGRETTVTEAANLLSAWVYQILRAQGGVCHFLMGGYDDEAKLYDIFPDGSLTKIDTFVSSGSGSTFAYGLLEDQFKKNMTKEEGINLALKAVNTALQRDSASGNGIVIYSIDKKGAKIEEIKSINATLL